jgi:hypothetical protein
MMESCLLESVGGAEGQILYEFYRKEMVSRLLILARSAMSARVKRATMIQDAIRILKNTSMCVLWERISEMFSDFSLRMKESGYPEKYRENVILSASEKMVEQDRAGTKPLHRENSWKKEERKLEKERKKINWFRSNRGQKYHFPIFCPITPGGRLAERWRKVVMDVGVGTNGEVNAKVVEQGGIPIQAILNKPPTDNDDDECSKEDCLPCTSGQTKLKSCHGL